MPSPKIAMRKALHLKDKTIRHRPVIDLKNGQTLTGTAYALYSEDVITDALGIAPDYDEPDAIRHNDAANAMIQGYVDAATLHVTFTMQKAIFIRPFGDLMARIAPNLYVNAMYLDVLPSTAQLYRDPNLKASPIVAKSSKGEILAIISPFMAKDSDYGL
jgi:hypothetical protein